MRMPFAAILLAVAAATAVEAASVGPMRTQAEEARKGRTREASFNFGPFFEYRRARARSSGAEELPPSVAALKTYWAVRPFYSQVRDERNGLVERDFLWPVATAHSIKDALWWRALVANGTARDDEPSWTFNVFPLWFSGRDRKDIGYWALFPVYGTHPHFLFMDDLTFVLWPVYHDYSVKGVRSRSVLWPLVSWKESPRKAAGVWPLWGTSRLRESQHSYVLWPIITWASYEEDRDTSGAGCSGMLWPLFGYVNRTREKQYLFLPPFFSWVDAHSVKRLRCPWPLIDVEWGEKRDRVSVFPFYEKVDAYSYRDRRNDESTHRIGWKLIEFSELTSDVSREKNISFFPFFTWDRRWMKKHKTGELPKDPTHSYLRIWPFYSRTESGGWAESRSLELIPIRHSEGFSRNWAPFWTFWSADTRPNGRTRHSLFWKIITWHTDSGG